MQTTALFVALLICAVTCSKLVYVEKPSDDGIAFVAKLARIHDVRGDYGNFVLVVDHDNIFPTNTLFPSFDNSVYSYFVGEQAAIPYTSSVISNDLMHKYQHAWAMDKCVFAIEKAKEDEFIGQVPYFYEVVLVPQKPLPAPFEGMMATADPNPKIADLIKLVNSNDLRTFVTYLSGEATSSPLITRQAQSTGAVTAQNWLRDQFTSFGFSVALQPFRNGYSSNVVATLQGKVNSRRAVLVTAHYDDRGPTLSSTTERAPGANDNGSGTGALLQIAKLIFNNKVTFGFTVILIAFSGEEQGLYGSAYAAEQYRSTGADIIAVLNADMIAYRSPNESPQLAFTARSSTPSLNNILSNYSKTYVPQLTLGTTTACCTDHSSFFNNGFAATSYFERNGAIADPQYHRSGDLVNRVGYDIDLQYPLIVQAVFAGLLNVADAQL